MSYVDEALARVQKQNPDQPEFLQAVKEVMESLRVVIEADEEAFRKEAPPAETGNGIKARAALHA